MYWEYGVWGTGRMDEWGTGSMVYGVLGVWMNGVLGVWVYGVLYLSHPSHDDRVKWNRLL